MALWHLAFPVAIAVAGPGMLFGLSQVRAQDRQSAPPEEIKQIEQQVDRIEQDALATIPSLAAGSPQRLLTLGKLLFYDKALSVNRNEACAFCHMPQTGFQDLIGGVHEALLTWTGNNADHVTGLC